MLINAAVLVIWAFGLGNIAVAYPGVWGAIAVWTLGILVVSHTAETLFVRKGIKAAKTPFWSTVLASLVFGHAHNRRYL